MRFCALRNTIRNAQNAPMQIPPKIPPIRKRLSRSVIDSAPLFVREFAHYAHGADMLPE